MPETLFGEIRNFLAVAAGVGSRALRLTFMESVAVAQVEPPGVEMTRAGKRFLLGNNAAITGIAPVQVLPTTAPQWSIYNPSTTKTVYLEEVGMYLTSGTPGVGGVLFACLYSSPAIVGASTTGTKISSASDDTVLSSEIIVTTGQTITTPTAPNWYQIASNPSPNVTAFASSTYLENRNIQGAIAIKPRHALGLAVISPAGTNPLFAPFARWIEVVSAVE